MRTRSSGKNSLASFDNIPAPKLPYYPHRICGVAAKSPSKSLRCARRKKSKIIFSGNRVFGKNPSRFTQCASVSECAERTANPFKKCLHFLTYCPAGFVMRLFLTHISLYGMPPSACGLQASRLPLLRLEVGSSKAGWRQPTCSLCAGYNEARTAQAGLVISPKRRDRSLVTGLSFLPLKSLSTPARCGGEEWKDGGAFTGKKLTGGLKVNTICCILVE